ncbi:hypothetical protein AlacWU_03933 [Aspergillus niger]|nr:hypothetical protein AlacWU_03933 [Aspergillus niger]
MTSWETRAQLARACFFLTLVDLSSVDDLTTVEHRHDLIFGPGPSIPVLEKGQATRMGSFQLNAQGHDDGRDDQLMAVGQVSAAQPREASTDGSQCGDNAGSLCCEWRW